MSIASERSEEMSDAGAGSGGRLEPIVCTQLVSRAPAEAFRAFTQDLGSWWDPRLTPDASTFRGAELEPRVGGSVRFVHDGNAGYEFAKVTSWRPGEQVGMVFWLALDPKHPTTLTVDFTPSPQGSLVRLAHGGWTADNAALRSTFGEWPSLLGRYAAHLDRAEG
jgi:uncharacterized protein YndB with AHSA1/START domain